jgi:hypothetical protein
MGKFGGLVPLGKIKALCKQQARSIAQDCIQQMRHQSALVAAVANIQQSIDGKRLSFGKNTRTCAVAEWQ